MFGRNYYALVSGLREYALDAEIKGFDAAEIRDEIVGELSAADAADVRLLYACYDCENLVSICGGSPTFNALGNFSREELEAEYARPSHLPEWAAKVVRAYADPEGEDAAEVDTSKRFGQSLFAAYYDACSKAGSRFLREWAEFDRTLRNILAASAARAAGRPVEDVVVGGGDAAEQIRRSSAADFGLRGEYEFADAVVAAVNDEQDILAKEHRIDTVRWAEADELSTFDYFDINAVLAYLVKVNMVARWSVLDAARGREMFRRLLSDMDRRTAIDAATAK